MKRYYLAWLLILALSGCYHAPDDARPAPDSNSVADASEQSIRLLAAELAKVARDMAAKADEFEDHGQVFEFEVPLNKIALKSSLQKASDAFDAEFSKDEQGNMIYDAAKFRKTATERAEGFERVAEGKK